jgi:hypothetical protein
MLNAALKPVAFRTETLWGIEDCYLLAVASLVFNLNLYFITITASLHLTFDYYVGTVFILELGWRSQYSSRLRQVNLLHLHIRIQKLQEYCDVLHIPIVTIRSFPEKVVFLVPIVLGRDSSHRFPFSSNLNFHRPSRLEIRGYKWQF